MLLGVFGFTMSVPKHVSAKMIIVYSSQRALLLQQTPQQIWRRHLEVDDSCVVVQRRESLAALSW